MSNQIIICPHCEQSIEVLSLNCGIFRCGVFKNDINIQINPHLNKIECDKLVQNNLIYGCSKPFKINTNGNVEKCDYI